MPRIVRAHQHDTVDAICHRTFGRIAGLVEQVLELNPGLAEFGPVLPQGTPVALPDAVSQQPRRTRSVQLWD
ncbi:P2-like prophage tail protein X [Modicisalibacter ilicicola DSM 19980]|uniref:p2-like prophage tail protein X n=1 Tax=Modicisalibacter ilicicola DSM 19980 TaxID=1121942 RepID=A0A1M4Y4H4_9GAMM|nr:tail protein X [Halomonas ilicicola]SHF00579.1 P2-like prophage tail protein X [Halomonas ilicicola DSM 19980]